jgi:nicotinamide-nucleotide amidase
VGPALDFDGVLAEILTIGDELCRGEIVDSNSSWLAAELWERGVTTAWMTSCRDDARDMRRAFADAAGRADMILVSGGLGPTEDDLTVDVLAEVLGQSVVTHDESLARMHARFAKANFTLTPNNLRQVRVPAEAKALVNPAGLAPGFEVSLHGKPTFVFPGVPRELKALWETHVAARIEALARGAPHIARRIYRVFGVGESQIDHRLKGLVDGVPGATLHFQVAFPETLVKIVIKGDDRATAEVRLAAADAELRTRLGPLVYSWTGPGGVENDSLAQALGRRLAEHGQSLAVAESCTGGMLGALVTDVAGASAWFKGGFIAYENALKQSLLGVQAETLATHGAVSEACATEMAQQARARTGASVAAAISGIAGPDGGTADKPVGTVHVAVVGADDVVAHKRYVFPGARDQVRRLAAYWAMKMVLDQLAR